MQPNDRDFDPNADDQNVDQDVDQTNNDEAGADSNTERPAR